MKSSLLLLFLILSLAACGERPVRAPDDRDGSMPPADHGSMRDRIEPVDRRLRDACLPIPAKQVSGKYAGTWKGIWRCPGLKGEAVSGTLSFRLSPAGSPESFNVNGAMTGTVQPVMTFKGSIKGKMGCTALSASMPDITVSSGALIFNLTGAMRGAFSTKAGSTHGFRNGTWQASEAKLKCDASGSWETSYTGP